MKLARRDFRLPGHGRSVLLIHKSALSVTDYYPDIIELMFICGSVCGFPRRFRFRMVPATTMGNMPFGRSVCRSGLRFRCGVGSCTGGFQEAAGSEFNGQEEISGSA